MKRVSTLSILRITLPFLQHLFRTLKKKNIKKYFLVEVDERMEEVSGGGCKKRPQKIRKGVYSFSILVYSLVLLPVL